MTANVLAGDLPTRDDDLRQDAELDEQIDKDDVYELIESGMLGYSDLIRMILDNDEEINRWLAALSVLGWSLTLLLIIVFPPTGIASALLALLGLKISTICGAFGLASLLGAW